MLVTLNVFEETFGSVCRPSLYHGEVKPVLKRLTCLFDDFLRFLVELVGSKDFFKLKSPRKVENQVVPLHARHFAILLKLLHECSRSLLNQVHRDGVSLF